MTLSPPRPDSTSPAGDVTCPHCSTAMRAEGEPGQHYWSCRSCNLVFLV